MKKIIYFNILSLSLYLFSTGCEMDLLPPDGIFPENLIDNIEGLNSANNGNYAMLKDLDVDSFSGLPYVDQRHSYVRHINHLKEFPSDNVMISGPTPDPLYLAFSREHTAAMGNASYLWYINYKIINATNLIIEGVDEGNGQEFDQVLGENYFMRALMHLDLVTLFAKPYSHGPENTGVVLRLDSSESNDKGRATVGQIYEQIVSDLRKASGLMSMDKGPEYASKEAAWALLSRAYLHMEKNDSAVYFATQVIESNKYELATRENYLESFYNTPNSPESILIIKHTVQDNRGQSSLASMYITDTQGWGEIYASEPLREALREYPDDVRNDLIVPAYLSDGVTVEQRNGYEKYYISKFSYQEGYPMLNSPHILRLSEVYLNRAEAYAKLGNIDEAIEDVNAIRERAGLSGTELYTAADLKGMPTVLDVVLHERRLELAYEGFRFLDLVRNERDIDRSYPGAHLTEGTDQVIPWNADRNVYYIPELEVLNNQLITQNP